MDNEIINRWYKLRFGKEGSIDDDYYIEWVHRFQSGNTIAVMDNQSLRCFVEVIQDIHRERIADAL